MKVMNTEYNMTDGIVVFVVAQSDFRKWVGESIETSGNNAATV